MFSAIGKRLTYTNVAVTLALVFAMSGGAYAASRYVITSTKQISPKVLKALTAKAGVNGPVGPQGPAGPPGPQGTAGANGTNGTNGSSGVSVAGKEVPKTSSTCNHQGGTELTSASGTEHVCNGQTGFTKTLPKGETLAGHWVLAGNAASAFDHYATAVSFAIPLSAAPAAHLIRPSGMEAFYNSTTEQEEERAQPLCPGSANEPTAHLGSLCVYISAEVNFVKILGASVLPGLCSPQPPAAVPTFVACATGTEPPDRFGFNLVDFAAEPGEVFETGTWAVTAE